MDYAPVLIAIFFIAFAYAVASSKGVVGILASGLALAAATATLLAGFEFLPGLAKTWLDISTTWRFTLGVAAGAASVVFLASRIVLAFILKRLFNRDGWLHPLCDGTGGGILSLGPSLVTVFLLFTCIRAAGTVQELNYIDSLAREGIRSMGGSIPSYPISATWRNAIERLPFLAPALDATDPFSRRPARNAAAFVLAHDGVALRNHLVAQPGSGVLMDSPKWQELVADPEVADALAKLDRVALVTSPAVRVAAEDPARRRDLTSVVLEPAIKSFVDSLKSEPAPEPADDF